MLTICRHCLETFSTKSSERIFCSNDCSAASRRKLDQVCEWCGVSFWRRRSQSFCSSRCSGFSRVLPPKPVVVKVKPSIGEVLEAHSRRDPDGCLLWTRRPDSEGYGALNRGGSPKRVHRLAWEQAHGPIPKGLVVDHQCHNEAARRGECLGGRCRHRLCIEVSHLRLTTYADNSRASVLVTSTIHAAQTHCVNGHPFDEQNTYVRRDTGGRCCRQCSLDRKRESYGHWAAARDELFRRTGENVRASRELMGMSKAELGRRASVSVDVVTRFEAGARVRQDRREAVMAAATACLPGLHIDESVLQTWPEAIRGVVP